MPTLATLLSTILSGFRAAIAASAAVSGRSVNPAHAARTALLCLVWGRIGRMATRFENLFARWRAGTLPKPRPSRARVPATPREKPKIPTGRAWLVVVMGYEAAGRGSQLQHLLAHPDMPAFLQAAPQAGRILRPLCHMLGIDPPLQPPPRAPLARQPRPQPDAPPAGSRPPQRPLRPKPPAPALRFSPA